MKIEPGMLCWIGWAPDDEVRPGARGTDPRNKQGVVRGRSVLAGRWTVIVEDGEIWEVRPQYIVPIPPETVPDREKEREHE